MADEKQTKMSLRDVTAAIKTGDEDITEAVLLVAESNEDISKVLADSLDNVSEKVKSTSDGIKTAIDESSEESGVSTEEKRENSKFYSAIQSTMSSLFDVTKKGFQSVINAEKLASGLGWMAGIGAILLSIIDPAKFINYMVTALRSVTDLIGDLVNWWESDEGVLGLFSVLMDNWQAFGAIVAGVVVYVAGFATVLGWIGSAIAGVATFLAGAASAITLPIAAAVLAVAAIVAAFWKMADIKEEMGLDSIWDAFPVMIASVKDLFASLINGIVDFINGIIEFFGGDAIEYNMPTDNELKAKQKIINERTAAMQTASDVPVLERGTNTQPVVNSVNNQVQNNETSNTQTNVIQATPSLSDAFMSTMAGPSYR